MLGGQHSRMILPMVGDLLSEAGLSLRQLDALAFGRGPGLFTGLRIGTGVAQGLAFGADLPVVPVSSLAATAQGQDAVKVLAAFDARMHQVYWGAFTKNEAGLVELQGEELVVDPNRVPVPHGEGWLGAGCGWDQYHEILRQRLGGGVSRWHPRVFPHACDIVTLALQLFEDGKFVSPEQAQPVYLRDEVAARRSRSGAGRTTG